MTRVLVVGGAGLVGSHLVDRLLAEGNEVIAIDDLSRGSYASIAHLKREPRFAFLEHDVAKSFRAEVDAVFHLAVPSTRMACDADPVKAAMTCVTGTMNVLEVAAANHARVVLVTATERWGEGVRCAEALAVDFAKSRGADVRVVRQPSAYGPRMAPDGDHIVTELVLQALRGEDLRPRARLERRLRLAYVDDVVETLVRTMNSEQRVPAVIAPSSESSVLELAHLIAEAAGLAGIEVTDASDDGPASLPMSGRPTLVDSLPASIALGLVPSVDLEEGLRRTVGWFEARTARRIGDRPSGVYVREERDTMRDPMEAAPAPRRAG
ncbi:MAG: UDP-glucuronate decarboxylase [Myxococcales bacterium]|nr:UDP-glucuronate decarboxylase [Myxococcales bacterium]